MRKTRVWHKPRNERLFLLTTRQRIIQACMHACMFSSTAVYANSVCLLVIMMMTMLMMMMMMRMMKEKTVIFIGWLARRLFKARSMQMRIKQVNETGIRAMR
uniref:Uncharacterized protein n=1 Tax=Glossina pallidipes TaxID=7398 RepID=A0A1B0A1M1_GLOPL